MRREGWAKELKDKEPYIRGGGPGSGNGICKVSAARWGGTPLGELDEGLGPEHSCSGDPGLLCGLWHLSAVSPRHSPLPWSLWAAQSWLSSLFWWLLPTQAVHYRPFAMGNNLELASLSTLVSDAKPSSSTRTRWVSGKNLEVSRMPGVMLVTWATIHTYSGVSYGNRPSGFFKLTILELSHDITLILKSRIQKSSYDTISLSPGERISKEKD